jgi:small-conductance mechanosensitive channel
MLNDHTIPALTVVNMLGVLGIAVWHLQGRRRPTARLIVQIVFFTAMSVTLMASDIIPWRVYEGVSAEDHNLSGLLARLLWWTHLAWALIGFVRLYIVLDRRPQEARLLQDLIVSAVYLGVSIAIAGLVFGAPVGTLVATSGVVAIVIGLAMQNTLGDLFSGVALTLGRPFSIGDWIQLADGTEGRVVETNWRSAHILTAAHNMVVLPNSVLARLSLTNVTYPDESHVITIPLRIAAVHRPAIIEHVIMEALGTCRCIVQNPAPVVVIRGIDAVAIEIELQLRVASPASRTPARNEVLDIVFQQCTVRDIGFAPSLSGYLWMSSGRRIPAAER